MTDELICNGVSLDLSAVIPVPISYAIADVKDPSKRKKTFSKEITLPSTMKNNAFFAGSFRYTSTESGVNFDATAKAEIVLKKRGVQVLKGVIKLNSVSIDSGVVTYKCQVFSESVDVFLLLQNIAVNELDWSAYTHTLNRTNIKNSWTSAIGSGYYYPLIDRRARVGATIWNTTDLIPYVYLRETLLKCFEFIGLTWDSDFLDSTLFKSILFGYGGGELKNISAQDVLNRKIELDNGDFFNSFTAFLNTSYILANDTSVSREISVAFPNSSAFDDDNFTYTTTTDIYNQFDDGEITVQLTGNYAFNLSMEIDYTVNYGTMTFNGVSTPAIYVRRNGTIIQTISCSGAISTTATGTFVFDTNTLFSVYCEAGDVLSFDFRVQGASVTAGIGVSYQNVSIDLVTSNAIEFDFYTIDEAITDGGSVVLNKFLPNMKCSDFLLNCIRQFNLYIGDPSESGVCKIEPLSDYYQATTVFDDITHLIDHDKETTVVPSANTFNKNILFSYKKQTHTDFVTYFDKWGTEYNNLNQTQGSYYAKGDYKIDLTWATIVPYEVSNGILVPRFIKIEGNVIKPNAGDPVICFRNGSKTGSWTFKDTVGTGQEVLTTYPCIHHFNNWNNPTFDLAFRLVNEVFYVATTVTNNNCYSAYYFDFINEMTSSAGQIVNTYVYWKETDIKDLDFSKFKMINGALFRLNEIKEFAPETEDSTKIELVKVLKAKKKNRQNLTIPKIAPTSASFVGSPVGVGVDTGVSSGGKNDVLNYSNLSKG